MPGVAPENTILQYRIQARLLTYQCMHREQKGCGNQWHTVAAELLYQHWWWHEGQKDKAWGAVVAVMLDYYGNDDNKDYRGR